MTMMEWTVQARATAHFRRVGKTEGFGSRSGFTPLPQAHRVARADGQ